MIQELTDRKTIGSAIVVVLVALLPMLVRGPVVVHVLFMVLVYGYLALAWNILGGMTGQYSFGHQAFVGIGGYTSTVLFNDLGLSPLLGMLVGCMLAGIAALLVGPVVLRLRGYYLVLGTLALAGALYGVVVSIDRIGIFEVRGADGVLIKALGDSPLYLQSLDKVFFVYVALAMAVIAVVVTHLISRSKLGYWMRAIREDEDAAQAIGINTPQVKLLAFTISAALTAAGGTLLAQYALVASPDWLFGTNIVVLMIMSAVVGGTNRTLGPVLGAILVAAPSEFLRFQFGSLWGTFPLMMYGVVLVIIVMVLPRGVADLLGEGWGLLWERRGSKWRYLKSEA